jgi:hypothetical protein
MTQSQEAREYLAAMIEGKQVRVEYRKPGSIAEAEAEAQAKENRVGPSPSFVKTMENKLRRMAC